MALLHSLTFQYCMCNTLCVGPYHKLNSAVCKKKKKKHSCTWSARYTKRWKMSAVLDQIHFSAWSCILTPFRLVKVSIIVWNLHIHRQSCVVNFASFQPSHSNGTKTLSFANTPPILRRSSASTQQERLLRTVSEASSTDDDSASFVDV